MKLSISMMVLIIASGCPLEIPEQLMSGSLGKNAALELRESKNQLLNELEPGVKHYSLVCNGQIIGQLAHNGEELTSFFVYDWEGKRTIDLSRKDNSFTDLMSYSILDDTGEPVTTFYDNLKEGVPQVLQTGPGPGRIYDCVKIGWQLRGSFRERGRQLAETGTETHMFSGDRKKDKSAERKRS